MPVTKQHAYHPSIGRFFDDPGLACCLGQDNQRPGTTQQRAVGLPPLVLRGTGNDHV